LRALGETIQAVKSSLELGEVLTTIAEQATKLCEADASLITQYVESEGTFRPTAGWNTSQTLIQALQAGPPTWGRGVTGKSAATGRPAQIPDILDEIAYPFRELLAREGYRAILSIPMIRDRTLLGHAGRRPEGTRSVSPNGTSNYSPRSPTRPLSQSSMRNSSSSYRRRPGSWEKLRATSPLPGEHVP